MPEGGLWGDRCWAAVGGRPLGVSSGTPAGGETVREGLSLAEHWRRCWWLWRGVGVYRRGVWGARGVRGSRPLSPACPQASGTGRRGSSSPTGPTSVSDTPPPPAVSQSSGQPGSWPWAGGETKAQGAPVPRESGVEAGSKLTPFFFLILTRGSVFIDLRERRRWVASRTCPHQGSNLQPGCVPVRESNPRPFGALGDAPTT